MPAKKQKVDGKQLELVQLPTKAKVKKEIEIRIAKSMNIKLNDILCQETFH